MTADQLDRLRAMRDDDGQTRDLSDKDRAAIGAAVEEIERLREDYRAAREVIEAWLAATVAEMAGATPGRGG